MDWLIKLDKDDFAGKPELVFQHRAGDFQRLVGLSIAKGFLKNAAQLLGGIEGCTHLRELLQQMGTVAFQTMFSIQSQKRAATAPDAASKQAIHPLFRNTCYTYNEHGPLATRAAEKGRVA